MRASLFFTGSVWSCRGGSIAKPRPAEFKRRLHGEVRTRPEADLRRLRAPAVCPKGATEQPAEQPRLRRPGANPLDERLKKAPGTAEAETDDIEVADIEGDEAIEDAEELEDDAEDIGEDIEVGTDRDEEQ